MSDDGRHSMILEFDRQKPAFSFGFECGRIWALLREYPASEIAETMHNENTEMILRMAEATGRQVVATPISDDHVEAVFAPSEETT